MQEKKVSSEFGGIAVVGTCSTAVAGHSGIAVAGFDGIAVTGLGGLAVVKEGGTATARNKGTAIAIGCSIAVAGDEGRAISGGCAMAGRLGEICIRYWDSTSDRHRTKVGYIGEDGLKPNVLYRLNEEHEFLEVDREEWEKEREEESWIGR